MRKHINKEIQAPLICIVPSLAAGLCNHFTLNRQMALVETGAKSEDQLSF